MLYMVFHVSETKSGSVTNIFWVGNFGDCIDAGEWNVDFMSDIGWINGCWIFESLSKCTS